jgi:hypothetical protein
MHTAWQGGKTAWPWPARSLSLLIYIKLSLAISDSLTVIVCYLFAQKKSSAIYLFWLIFAVVQPKEFFLI